MQRLNHIKDNIHSEKVNFLEKFPNYSDQALLVNGLHSFKVGKFCTHLHDILQEKDIHIISDIVLPEKYHIPQLRKRDKKLSKRMESLLAVPLPSSVQMGETTITVKHGDITSEQVDAAVTVVGKELQLKGTAIGSAFLKLCPRLNQLLEQQPKADRGECRIVTTSKVSGLPMKTLYHAVLYKLPERKVKQVVKDLVRQILQQAAQSKLTSVAFPPLGIGRRFGYELQTTATAMFQAFLQFPGAFRFLSIVAYDFNIAETFAVILQTQFAEAMGKVPLKSIPPVVEFSATKALLSFFQRRWPPTPPQQSPSPKAEQLCHSSIEEPAASRSESSDSESDTEPESFYQEEVKDSPRGDFVAVICAKMVDDLGKAVDVLLMELKTTFLWQETLRGQQSKIFWSVDRKVLDECFKEAARSNVLLSIENRGLNLCGEKVSVKGLLSSIQSKMLEVLGQPGTGTIKRLGLPSVTCRLPSYWKLYRKVKGFEEKLEKSVEKWEKQEELKLVAVTPEEMQAVAQLVQDTWVAAKAQLGADARNLSHTGIKVNKVERLENPCLWSKYIHQRETFFNRLKHNAFPAIESLQGSSGPVQTTSKVLANGLLDRDIYHQINEHYLFHGTKLEILSKICVQGLDFRVSRENSMLGKGVYTCESSTKADQYADWKQDRRNDQELTMILVRVVLGHPFVNKLSNPEKFSRPPCQKCSNTLKCRCAAPVLFDSVIDDVRLFREFVLYDQHVVYPEYFITYNRV